MPTMTDVDLGIEHARRLSRSSDKPALEYLAASGATAITITNTITITITDIDGACTFRIGHRLDRRGLRRDSTRTLEPARCMSQTSDQ